MAIGRAVIRQAVMDYLAPPAVAGLNALHRELPKDFASAVDYLKDQAKGTASGAVGIIVLGPSRDAREGLNESSITYDVELQLLLRSTHKYIEDSTDDWDAILDGITSRLRENHRLGDNPDIYEAAVERLEVDPQGEPTLIDEASELLVVVRFEALQWVND